MDDTKYLATLLAILTSSSPAGIDPADPYGRADDGIDRVDGFGSDVTVAGLEVVDGPHGDELEVTFALALPTDDPDWDGVPDRGTTRMPFDAQWRRLSGFADPAAYAPEVALRVMTAAGDHAAKHQHGGRLDRARTEWRARARAALPSRAAQRQLLLEALAGEGVVTQVGPDRFELKLHDAPADEVTARPADVAAIDAVPAVITFVVTPEEWEEILVDQSADDLALYVAETLAIPDPDERFVIFYGGQLHRSSRAEPPPVRGRARERAWTRLRAEHPSGPDVGWYAVDPNDFDRHDNSTR